ncbi:MAG: ABC transporter permease [bacterium]|nr:ABC transporter permease [bacterium]
MRTLGVSLRIAWANLMVNKLRSMLTLLGMIIGVSAVIAIVSLGEGLRSDFASNINSLGSDVIFLAPKAPKRPGQARGDAPLFKMGDMEAIKRQAPAVGSVVPGIDVPATVKHRDKVRQSHIWGAYEDYLDSSNTDKLESGRFMTKADRMNAARVVVIGDELTNDLFEDWENPVGQDIKINGVKYRIIGKFERRAMAFSGAPDVNTGLMAPLTTVQKRVLGTNEVFWVSIYLKKGATLAQAKEEVATVMRQRRRIRNAEDDNFQLMSPDDFAEMANQFVNVLVAIFGAIAFMSLLVGGIGIMNIMLVSVTERTREIGLRMAVGANRATVLSQFLIEAMVLTLIGGLIGMGMGYGSAKVVSMILEQVIKSQWSATIPVIWVIYAITVSVLTGVIFGVYPAYKASQLDPVEAMRYE